MTTNTDNEKRHQSNEINDEVYWRKMYDELENQMYQMMEMTVELIDKELNNQELTSYKGKMPKIETNLNIPENFEKEYRRLKLFEHRINVTLLGKITLKYIALKKRLRNLIKGK